MGEHNLLNPGFVGPLVNIHTGDTFYFPNFRTSGGQLAGLPSLSYPRRDNVCSLSWNPSEPCNGYPQSYFNSPMSINPSFNRSCEVIRPEEGKCYYSNNNANRESCSDGNNLKREERARDNSLTSEHGLHNGMTNSGTYTKYDYGTDQISQDPSSCQSLESDSSSSLLNEGSKTSTSDPQTLVSPGSHTSIASGGGGCHISSLDRIANMFALKLCDLTWFKTWTWPRGALRISCHRSLWSSVCLQRAGVMVQHR